MTKNDWLIDPINITNFKADNFELELMILFWVCAAGKKGVTSANCLSNMLVKFAAFMVSKGYKDEFLTPFNVVNYALKNYDLSKEMKDHGIGCYGKPHVRGKSRTFRELIESNINLKTCSVHDLEKIHGIGSKTSRCFLLHSRPNVQHAGLDTHALKYLKDQGYDVPKSTPNKKKYLEIEKIWLGLVKESKKSAAEFDLEIWRKYSGNIT